MSALDKLFGRGNVTYHIAVAEALDSVAAAIFAEQIAFWQARSEDGWAFRTSEEIKEYTALTRRIQDTARKKLKESGVMEEKTDGAPPRLYFRLDLEALSRLIEQCAPNAPKRQPNAPNVQTVCTETPAHIEGEESEKERSSEDASSDAEDDSKVVELPPPKPVPLNKYYVSLFYDGVKEQHNVSLRPNQYEFHLGQMQRMLDQYNPSDEECERVIQHMIEKLPNSPKMDALTAMQDVRFGRDTGEAWEGPAPWEKAKQEKEVINPHSDKGEALRDKPRKDNWYKSTFPMLSWGRIDQLLATYDSHTDIMEEITK